MIPQFAVPLLGLVGFGFAVWTYASLCRRDAGSERIRELAEQIHRGAMVFLRREYGIIVVFAGARVTQAARTGGTPAALDLAFRGGSVMGVAVAALGVLGLGVVYWRTRDPLIVNGFAMGASSVALFARVGGGIYTKSADIGADLVGKVEEGIPEDDPRNSGVIADNLGDCVYHQVA